MAKFQMADCCSPICVVCHGPTNGIWHYGVECCRACASFFHRSVKDRRQYICRNQHNCIISNGQGLRNSCRSCRLKRCIDVGMVFEEGKKKDKQQEKQQLPSLHHDAAQVQPLSALAYDSSDFALSSFSVLPPYSASSSFASNPLDESKIPETAKLLHSLRQFNHGLRAFSIVEGLLPDMVATTENNNHQFKLLNHAEMLKYDRGTAMLIYALMNEHLPTELKMLPKETKIKLHRYFGKQFMMMNKCEMTKRTFPDPESPFAMMIPGGVLDRNQMDTFLSDYFEDAEHRARYKKCFIERHYNFGKKRYCIMNVTQLEFAVLTGLLFWNSVEHVVFEDQSSELCSAKQAELYAELDAIIREEMAAAQQNGRRSNPDNAMVSARFGKLMNLLHQLAIFTSEVSEVTTMAKIFMDFTEVWDDLEITFPS